MGMTPIHGAAVPYLRNAIAFHQLHIPIKQKSLTPGILLTGKITMQSKTLYLKATALLGGS